MGRGAKRPNTSYWRYSHSILHGTSVVIREDISTNIICRVMPKLRFSCLLASLFCLLCVRGICLPRSRPVVSRPQHLPSRFVCVSPSVRPTNVSVGLELASHSKSSLHRGCLLLRLPFLVYLVACLLYIG